MIKAQNISLSFDNNTYVFKDLSFEIREFEHFCFAGESGRGKSSVIKMLQAYVLPQNGYIEINGLVLEPKNINKIRSEMIYVPQNINLPVKTGDQILSLLESDADKAYIYELLTELGLSKEYLFSNFDEISGGQKQRVVIAICIAQNRKILLFDEPTASLDAESGNKLINLVKNLKNKTIVSASHNSEWMAAADKTILL